MTVLVRPAHPRALPLFVAAAAPIAIGGVIAAHAATPEPVFAVPAVVFGVTAATSPALYIATAVAGAAPTLGAVARAFVIALGAFGIALAGLVLPVAFLTLSSTSTTTGLLVASAAIAGAALLGLVRLAGELRAHRAASSVADGVFALWAIATAGIAGRLWWDLVHEVIA